MVDIHCHLLYGVDDGAATIEESVAMLQRAKEQNISAIVLTPHCRHGMFPYKKADIEQHFAQLAPYAARLGVNLSLGTEYHVDSETVAAMDSGRCHTLAGSRYVLAEYSHDSEYDFIYRMTRELIANGYVPVLAHVERYACMTDDIDLAGEIQNLGAWIQLNADAVLGLEGRGPKKYCRQMLEEDYVDVIASDSHGIKERACHMDKCFDYVAKKIDARLAKKLMEVNPAMIVAGK